MRKLFVLFVLTALPLFSLADVNQVEIGGLYYNLYDAVEASETEGIPASEAYAEVTSSEGSSYTGEITIPASVEYESKTYPVTRVGNNAFSGCNDITSISFPTSLRTIGDYGFYDNYNLKSVDLPEGLTSIGSWAFGYVGNSIGGVKVVLPSTLTSIGNNAFRTNNTISVITSRIQTPFEISTTVFSSSSSAVLSVPSGTRSVYQATTGWNSFDEIYEGEIDEASDGVLNYRFSINGGTATVISGDYSELRNVTIPGSVNLEGTDYAVKAIGNNAFKNSSLDTLIISSGVETIGNQAFQYSYSLKSLELPASIRSIGSNAFDNCYNLQNLVIPEGVVSIGNSAFIYCYGIRKLELPSTLTTIGNNAFWNIRDLTTVISRIAVPFEIHQNVFAASSNGSYNDAGEWVETYTLSKATLYVPDGTKSAYQAIDGWNMFAEIIEGNPKEATVDGLNYFYLEGKGNATVIGRADDTMRNINIPSTVNIGGTDYSVKSIGARAFYDISLDTVTVANGVETIEEYAFYDSDGINILTLPSTLKSIGKYAFVYAYITSLVLPEGLTSIGENAFRSCHRLTKVELPSSLTSIGSGTFTNCENIATVISRIRSPFEISKSAFARSFSTNWNSETEKYDSTFTASNAIIYVPVGTKTAYQAIEGWTMFADIIEGEPVETTVDGLNYLCIVGAGTATVTGRADETLRNITIPSTIPYEGSTYNVKAIANRALESCSIDTLVISEGIETIGDYAFQYNYNSLKSVTLPSSLRTIGNYAFYYNYGFNNLVIPQGVETIGDYAFRNCSGLKRVELGSTIKSIGEFAFYNLNNLKTVVSRIQTPIDIKGTVFCQSYNTTYNSETEKYDTTYTASPATLCVPVGTLAAYQAIQGWTVFTDIVEGELIEITSGDLAYLINADRKTATVIKGTNYRNLTNVNIPSTFMYEDSEYSVKDIDSNAFEETNITSLRIGEGVLKIGDYAFQNCTRMSSMSLPSTLTSIGEAAFRYCYQLSSIAIPASLTSIGDMAFTACTNVSSIVVAEGNTVYNSQGSNSIIETATNKLILGCKNSVIPDGVTEIGFEAFFNCQMTSMKIPSSVKTIGQEAFTSCGKLTEMILPEGVDSVSMNAFNDCYAMRTLQLPNSLRVMEYGAFGNCRGLENVVSYIENPTDLSEEVFGNDEDLYKQATLWVPKGKIATYQEKEGWKRFTLFDELLGDILTKPAVSYNGHYLVLTVPEAERAAIYYSSDGSEPTTLYTDTVSIYNIGVIKAISKRFGSFTVDTTSYDIQYVFDGITAKTAVGGVLANAFEWCGTGNVEKLDIVGTLNDDDFATIRSFAKLNTLDMSAAKLPDNALPSGAFADTKLVYYTAPSTLSAVGSNIFRGCNQLAAITWNSSTVELPEDVATDVANPNMLVYATTLSMIPYSIKNVVINGVANNILLADSTGNNNFYCPESFLARRISYTHNYQQKTSIGKSQGWETIALPFTVAKITHEKNGELTPVAVEDAAKPFWLYELGENGMEAATQIRANIPYLICMPNDDAYGDEYIQGGRVTFTAQNVQISTSRGITVTQGDRRFVPTYQRVDASADVYVLNVGQEVDGNAEGSVFVANLREVRPFEAYSIHTVNRSRIISVSSLGGGDATGISNPQLGGESANEIVKVYTLSGIFLKQGPRGDVLRSLPKGVYIINGKKVIK